MCDSAHWALCAAACGGTESRLVGYGEKFTDPLLIVYKHDAYIRVVKNDVSFVYIMVAHFVYTCRLPRISGAAGSPPSLCSAGVPPAPQ
jgi:hypothetical protein